MIKQVHCIGPHLKVRDTEKDIGLTKNYYITISMQKISSMHKLILTISCPNLNLLCVRQSNAASFCENYAKLYFDAKHLEKGLNKGW